jgi:hypothetical protein
MRCQWRECEGRKRWVAEEGQGRDKKDELATSWEDCWVEREEGERCEGYEEGGVKGKEWNGRGRERKAKKEGRSALGLCQIIFHYYTTAHIEPIWF